jgi:2-hydroxy-6-oxonona-2,4-dienedioate hydrolase
MQSTALSADGLDRSKLHFVEVDGIRTRYYEDGTGEPLVLFSGGEFASLYSLDAFSLNLPALARHFRVIAVDKLGQGHSDNPKTDADYSVAALLRHTVGFLRALGIQNAHLGGHSRGAWLVARVALEHPELAKTLVLVDTSTLAPEDPAFPSQVFYTEIANRTPPGPPTAETVRMEPDAQAAHSRAHITDDFVARLLEIARLPKSQDATEKMKTLGPAQWLPDLNRERVRTLEMIDERGLPVPTLLTWGFNDRSAPLPLGHKLFARIAEKTPRAEMHVLNGAGHYSFREQAPAFNRLVPAFCLG